MERANGFVKLHRSIREWGWYHDPVVKSVFIELLLTATFKEGQFERIKLMPGDAIVGRKALASTLGLTERQVRTALKKLQDTGEIVIKATNKFSLVTLVNWATYQYADPNSDQQPTNNRPANDQQPTNNRPHIKNVNNVKEGKKYAPTPKNNSASQKPEVFGSGNYDFDAIRKRARENIRQKIAMNADNAEVSA